MGTASWRTLGGFSRQWDPTGSRLILDLCESHPIWVTKFAGSLIEPYQISTITYLVETYRAGAAASGK